MKYIAFLISILFLSCNSGNKQHYTVPETPWPESLGNHRAVLQINQPAAAVELNILWRRHDRNPETKKFIIVHESGDTIQNIHRIQVNNERCHLAFGPVEKTGKYFFYYLPYVIQKNYGFYNKGYLQQENEPEESWLRKMVCWMEIMLKSHKQNYYNFNQELSLIVFTPWK